MGGRTHKPSSGRQVKAAAHQIDGEEDGGLLSQSLLRREHGPGDGHGVSVEVGGMADKTKKAAGLLPGMQRTVLKTLSSHAPGFKVGPTGEVSSGAGHKQGAHAQQGNPAFLVDGSVTDLAVAESHVTCKVGMFVATLPEKSMFAFLNGSATVDAGSTSEHALSAARADGVDAVVEDLVTTKIIPAIKLRRPDGQT